MFDPIVDPCEASANAGDRITLTNGIVLDVDTIFAEVFDLPGD
jgi:hypothetical protein